MQGPYRDPRPARRGALLTAALLLGAAAAAPAGPLRRVTRNLAPRVMRLPRSPRLGQPRPPRVITLPYHSTVSPGGPASDPNAQALLRRMLEALNSLTMEGDQVTVVARPGGLDVASEQHVIRNGARAYRLERRTPPRFAGEQIVDNGRLSWDYLPSANTVQVGPSTVQRQRAHVPQVMSQIRRGELGVQGIGQEDVAGHPCTILRVTSRAPGTASYTYWVDPTTGAQLKIEEYAPSGQRQYTSYYTRVTYSPTLAPHAFDAPRMPKDVRVLTPEVAAPLHSIPEAQAQAGFTVVQPAYLPDGYRFQSPSVTDFRGKKMVDLRYANGLNVLSLFETPNTRPGRQGKVNHPRPGVFIAFQSGLQLVLVGNLPDAEMQKVLDSVR